MKLELEMQCIFFFHFFIHYNKEMGLYNNLTDNQDIFTAFLHNRHAIPSI